MGRRLARGLVGLASAFALVGSVVGCVPVLPVLPQPTSVRETRSPLRAIDRLGRWEGGRFGPVEPDSVSPSHLYVIVHGWAPGWGGAAQRDRSLRSWEARDVEGRRFEPWIDRLADVIEGRDPYAVIVSYSWLDGAATSRSPLAQRNAWATTQMHGRLMAEAVSQAWSDDFIEGGGRMHFIGHSYGARVAAIGAISLPKAPQQITTFDSPDATWTRLTGGQTDLGDLLAKLPVGRGPGEVFVDNYVSMVGARYGSRSGVVDVALSPPFSTLDYRHRHLYPTDFYARTADRSIGLGWSPLLGGRPPAPGCYSQPYGRLDVQPGCGGLP